MSRVSVLYIIGDLGYGGAEKHLSHVLRQLDKSKYQLFVACFRKTGHYLAEVEKLNIPVIGLGVKRIYSPKGIIKLFFLSKFLKKNKIDIVHCYLYKANLYGTIAAKIARTPVIISKRSMNLLAEDPRKRHRLANKIISNKATAITAVCEAVRQLDIEQGISPDKVVTIYNGVKIQNTDRSNEGISAKKLELGLPDDIDVIGTVANMRHFKGHRYLLEAFAKTAHTCPNIRLLLVGDGPIRGELENLAKKLNINDKVVFAGHRDDVAQLLPLMDIFVLPSLSEGMSNALLEAMAAGLPCVATEAGGNPEIVQDGVSGLVVPCKDPQGLAGGILKLLRNKELAREMGKKGRERVLTDFSIEKMITKMELLYSRVLSGDTL